MRTIKVYNLYTNEYSNWDVPSKAELLENSNLTWGKRFDKIEREVVEGGIPMAMVKLQGH